MVLLYLERLQTRDSWSFSELLVSSFVSKIFDFIASNGFETVSAGDNSLKLGRGVHLGANRLIVEIIVGY